jgi:Outer membrane protein beta-barrel domain
VKDIDNIEEWYRDELNNYNVEPDASTWDSLSEELDVSAPLTDENISEWYKKEAAKLEERPDYTVWEKLSTKLDTTTVWDKLVVSLNRYEQYILWRNLVLKGSAVFLLFFGSYLAYDSYSNNNEVITDKVIIEENNETATSELAFGNISNKKKNVEENKPSTSTNSNTPIVTPNNKDNVKYTPEEKVRLAVKTAKENSNTVTKKKGRSKYNDSYASLNKIVEHYSAIYKDKLEQINTSEEKTIFTEIDRHELTEKDVSHLYASGEFLVKKDKNKIVFNSKRFSSHFVFGMYARRIYLGINAGIKKQGLISTINKNSDLANYSQNTVLDFGHSFGATVGLIVSDKFNIESNINFNSTAGYTREFDKEGVSFKEDLNLNYSTVSVLAKKMANKSTFDNKKYSTNMIAGVYGSFLTSSTSNINGVSSNINTYNKTDFGIVLGLEQDRYISKELIITPGIRYNQGIMNIANDKNSYNSARNFSFEFNLGIKYIFLKKG